MYTRKSWLTAIIPAVATCVVATTATAFARPIVSMGVYEEQASAACPNAHSCIAFFSVVATPLKITKVSCNFFYGADPNFPAVVTGVVLGRANGTETTFDAWQYLGPITAFGQNNSSEAQQYQVLADTLHVVKDGRPAIQVNIEGNSAINLLCTISGEQAAP